MGNCLHRNTSPVRAMKTDGNIIECEPPIKAKSHPNANLDSSPEKKHKNGNKVVRFSDDVVEIEGPGKVVRIKVVISKQELQALLAKGVSVEENNTVPQLQTRNGSRGGWLPTIPELN